MGISFDEFWEIYPRKVGKLDAEKAYTKALTKATVDRIRIGVEKFAANCGSDPKFVPHPATWLNAGRWDDERQEKQSVAGRWWGPKPEFPPENQRGPERPRALHWANVYLGSEAPQYRKMLDKANKPETDRREYRYDEERGGIWVSLKWLWG